MTMHRYGFHWLHFVRAALALCAAFIADVSAAAFDLQGHRGARGLAPENTLEAFRTALDIGVTTLETDLAVTKDGVLVLSHDPVLNPDITRGPDGAWLTAPGPTISMLPLAELLRYDVGRIKPGTQYAQQFSAQRPVDGARIPTLAQLFDLAKASGKSPRFNIETKLSPDKPAETPDPDTFARLVVQAVQQAQLSSRSTIQSFDWRTLLAARKIAPEIETVCLTYQSTLQDGFADGRRRPSPWLAGLDPADYGGSVPRLVKAAGLRRLVAALHRADLRAGQGSPCARIEGGSVDHQCSRRYGARHSYGCGRPHHRLPGPRPHGVGGERHSLAVADDNGAYSSWVATASRASRRSCAMVRIWAAIAGLAVSSRWKSSRNSLSRRQRRQVTKAPRLRSPSSMEETPKKSPVAKVSSRSAASNAPGPRRQNTWPHPGCRAQ